MPKQKPKLSQQETRTYRNLFLKQEKVGIAVGNDDEFLRGVTVPLSQGLRLEQVPYGLAHVYALPGVAAAVVLEAKLVVLATRILIRDCTLSLPRHDFPLDLSDPESNTFYQELIAGAIPSPPLILNPYLTGELPLLRKRLEGIIMAIGNGVRVQEPNLSEIPVTLLIEDEHGDELRCDFKASVEYSLKVKLERRERAHRRYAKREPIFPDKTPDFPPQEAQEMPAKGS